GAGHRPQRRRRGASFSLPPRQPELSTPAAPHHGLVPPGGAAARPHFPGASPAPPADLPLSPAGGLGPPCERGGLPGRPPRQRPGAVCRPAPFPLAPPGGDG